MFLFFFCFIFRIIKIKKFQILKESNKGCNTEEILAVLAHELGHWKLNHNIKNLILNEVNLK